MLLDLLLLAAGLVAGFINSVAGSGSMLTIPALMMYGLPAPLANGTNRVGLLAQGLFGIMGFRHGGVKIRPITALLVIPAVLGALLGAQIAVQLPEDVLNIAITIILAVMVGTVFLKPKRWERSHDGMENVHRRPVVWLALLLTGIYAGFIQIGSGYFILFTALLIGGMDLLRANVLKVIIQMALQLTVIPFYFYHGQIDWRAGLLLAAGMALGAWIGSKMAIKGGAKFLRYVIIGSVLLFVGYQLFKVLGS
ncbi:MAG: hypothetical protein CSA07_00360 [Bacteroidia bacterium]|nr:MAG: hypothetical protein CSA07_00360 [Bacteroidia bacterium]